MKPCFKLLGPALLGVVLAATLLASVNPKLLSYQGRLLNSSGNPVPNGTYSARFSFYNSLTLGTLLWQETTGIVTTSGDFTHLLGSVTAIPDSLFPKISNIWLQVQIGTEILTPRVRVTSAGYALQVHTIDQARGGIVSDSIVLMNSVGAAALSGSEPMTISRMAMNATGLGCGTSYYEPLDSKARGFGASPTAEALRAYMGTDGIRLFNRDGSWHTMLVHDSDGLAGGMLRMSGGAEGGVWLVNNFLGTTNPFFTMGGNSWVEFNTNATGDASVTLPADAISSGEILDEPGIVNTPSTYYVGLTTTMQDLATVTITTPRDGYIFLIGKACEVSLYNTIGANFAYLQIDETSGGGVSFPHYAATGANAFPNSNTFYYSLTTQRTYYKAAGTYTFRLEGMRGGTGTGAAASIFYPTLTAMYFSSSYGTVGTVVSGEDLGQFEQVTAVPAGLRSGTGLTFPAANIVDLRELELKAAKTQAEAERLQRQVLQEKLKRLGQEK